MKKFDFLIVISLAFYGLLALVLGYRMNQQQRLTQKEYRVEINRAMHQLEYMDTPNQLDLSVYETLMEIAYLPQEEQSQTRLLDFYETKNDADILIQPWYQDEKLKGYLKFTYRLPQLNQENLLVLVEIGLLMMELFMLAIMFFLRKRVLLPFTRLSQMPQELAKGHVRKQVIIEKNRFFQSFLMGLGQMKDQLEVSRKRQMELQREKQQLLLSLSHDIKTPLNLIRLYGKALHEDIYHEEADRKNAAKRIEEKSIEIETYVNQIMRTSREDFLDIEVKIGEFYLSELLEKVLDVYEEQCIVRHIKLKIGSYDNKLLQGDMDRSREVFDNLFENAFKYGDGREINISFYEEDGCQLIRFFNTGSVVNDHEYPHLFDSFFRGTNAKGKAGFGLGLFISKEIMRKMDGAIFAQKESDGMAFVLVFR